MKNQSIIKFLAAFLVYFVLYSGHLLAKTNIFAGSSLSPTEIIDSLNVIAAEHNDKEQYEVSIEYLHRILDLSLNTPDKHQYPQTLISLGRTYFLINNYSLSLQYLFDFIEESNTNQEMLSDAFGLIASNYNSLGDINKAHEYRLKSIEINEILGDTIDLANNYYNLGSLFFYQDVFEKAISYYTKSNELGYLINDVKLIYNSTAALGSSYGKINQVERALELNLKSLQIADSVGYITGQAYSLGNIGSNYLDLGDYAKAKKYINRSLLLKEQINDKWGQIGAHLSLFNLNRKTNNFELAEKHIFIALEIAKSINAKKRVADIYKEIADLYVSVEKNNLAVEYLNKHIIVKDSVMNESILNEMSTRKSGFAIQKKEYEIDLLKKDNQILASEQKAQRFKLMGFGLLAFLFLGVSILFRSLLSKQKKFTRLLTDKNNEIEKQKDKIQLQNKKLENSNKNLQQFAYVASHDLREPLRMINSYGKILNRRYKNILDKNGQEFLHFMTDAAERMDSMLLDLLHYAKTTANTQAFQEVNSAELIESVSNVTANLFLEKNGTLEVKTENMPLIKGRETQLYQLFQNFITNGMKYNHSDKPKITVDCQTFPDKHVFSFQDNGIGIPKADQVRVFEMFHRLHPEGEFEGTGIGLATCKKIADIHGGHITIDSEEGAGSTFYFHLPR